MNLLIFYIIIFILHRFSAAAFSACSAPDILEFFEQRE